MDEGRVREREKEERKRRKREEGDKTDIYYFTMVIVTSLREGYVKF